MDKFLSAAHVPSIFEFEKQNFECFALAEEASVQLLPAKALYFSHKKRARYQSLAK